MEKKKNNDTLTIILYVLIIAFVAISFTKKEFPNDIFFTIPCGQNILDNGFISTETLTYHKGLTFIDVRWLFDITITITHNLLGYNGIYCLTMIFSIILFESIFIALTKLYKKTIVSFIISIVSPIFLIIYLVPRAQIVSSIIFVWELYSIIQLLRTNKKRYYFILIILSIAIVNIHATLFPIFLVLFLPFIAEYFISKLKLAKRFNKITFENSKYYKNLIALFLVIIWAGFISPYPGTAYSVMFKTMSGKTNKYIAEMQILSDEMLCLWLTYIGIFWILGTFKKHIKAGNVFLIIGLSLMALYANRGLLIFILLANFPFCEILVSCYNSHYYFIFKEKIPKLDLILKIIYYAIFIFIFIYSFIHLYINIFKTAYITAQNEPILATQFLLEEVNLDDYVLYNGFNYGSYLEYYGIKTFIDSRAEVFEKPYNDVEIMYDNFQMESASSYEELETYIQKYNFNLFLVHKNFRIYHTMMDNPNHFNLIHLDDYFAIFELTN